MDSNWLNKTESMIAKKIVISSNTIQNAYNLTGDRILQNSWRI